MSRFLPPHCPHPRCPSRHGRAPFLWRRRGSYPRKVDGRRVQRFLCRTCGRSFSTQSFRLDYRLQRVHIHPALFRLLVSKVTFRQAARLLGIDRKTVARRARLFGRHARRFHEARLRAARARGGLDGVFQLDELETFETDRRLQPLTVPVLIERRSFFVVHVGVGTLPARGGLSAAKKRRKAELERVRGKRRSQSRVQVRVAVRRLGRVLAAGAPLVFESDRKSTYPGILREVFGGRVGSHRRVSSRARRCPGSVLFPINHTLARMRDRVSRLVRRNWGASKRRRCLRWHLWMWVAWRNYLRPVTVAAGVPTPGVIVGAAERRWEVADFLRWRVTL